MPRICMTNAGIGGVGAAAAKLDASDPLSPATLDSDILRSVEDCAWEAGFDDCVVICPIVITTYEMEEGPESASVFIQTVKTEGIRV